MRLVSRSGASYLQASTRHETRVHSPMNRRYIVLLGALASTASVSARAEHDIEFVAEHLPEVMMDNRYATLPIWSLGTGVEHTEVTQAVSPQSERWPRPVVTQVAGLPDRGRTEPGA